MKKQFAAIFAATAVLGVTTAFAANPFSDVTPDSWAYQAVSQLANTGVINGYPDGTFKGQNNITRYEMAQMVAKAMANQDRANAEQQAMINRLADEFSNELNNLGVRVARLEDRVGNVKVTGDARFRYQDAEHEKSQFEGRARIQFNANVNDRTEAVVRVKGAYEFGDASQSATATIDRAYVNHKFGERVSAKAGRYTQTFGGGLAYDDQFDGVQFNAGNDKVNFQAAYGYMTSSNVEALNPLGGWDRPKKDENPSVAYVGLNGKVEKHVDLGGFYARFNGDKKYLVLDSFNGGTDTPTNYKNVYGFNANANFNKVWVGGEWLKASNAKKQAGDNVKGAAWTAGIGYGNYDIKKAGTWNVKGQYFKSDVVAPVFDSTWNHIYTQGAKGWMATVDYALQNNVGLTANYGFDWKDQNGNDKADFYRADLNYKF